MRDFTLKAYKSLLVALESKGYFGMNFQDYLKNQADKFVILRHDVDSKPENALITAAIERDAGVTASYYFRIVKKSYDENIIKQIAELGHEIGYHYEDLSLCNGNYESAVRHFILSLEKFRKIYPVNTICMHGSPFSKWDNRDLWKKYNYKDFGIIAEPYFDIDFNDVFYLTDTGRRWDGCGVSIRDKIASKSQNNFDNLKFQSTVDIINSAQKGLLPDRIMINIHPQRWDDRFLPWAKELVGQNIKNVVKKVIVRYLLK